MSITIGIGKNQHAWIKKQTVKGTFTPPTAADVVLLTKDCTPKQARIFGEDKQKRMTRGQLGRIAHGYNAGDLPIGCYLKPAGSLGVAPAPDALLEGLFGKKTVTTGTKVEYTLSAKDADPVYLSAIVQDNFETYYIRDLVVTKMSAKFKPNEAFSGDFSCLFLRRFHAGTDALSAAIDYTATPITAIPVVDARKFDVGSLIIVGTDTHANAGYEVTAVDVATNTLTISGGVSTDQLIGAVVCGWVPAITESGVIVDGGFGEFQESIGGGSYATVYCLDNDIEIDNGYKALDREKGGADGYPSNIANGERKVTVKLTRYMTSDGGRYDYEANAQTAKALKLPAGTTAGSRFRFEMPNVQSDTPEYSGDSERSIALTCTAYETAALDDSVKLVLD